MWLLFCHCLFTITPSFGTEGSVCFMTVAFTGHIHLFFYYYLFDSISSLHAG